MRIVLDLQCCQVESRFETIGHYVLSFAKSIVRNRGSHEVVLALNGLLDGAIEFIRSEFYDLLPQENIRVWYTPSLEKKSFRQVAEYIREAFIASLEPDLVHIMDFSRSLEDETVMSIGVFDKRTPVGVSVYDLDIREEEYLKRASVIFVFSEEIKDSVNRSLSIPRNKIVNVTSNGHSDGWTEMARRAIDTWERLLSNSKDSYQDTPFFCSKDRPRLAYFSPLPPEKSGISNYSDELLPELSRYYDIEAIVTQKEVKDGWIRRNCPIRDLKWFMAHVSYYDRVLYHVGNSPIHGYMIDLLEVVPGVVVLHDFFLSHAMAYMEQYGVRSYQWTRSLYESHGYIALKERFYERDPSRVLWRYPCSFGVIQNALGMIVHSQYSKELAKKWYGDEASKEWVVIPHLKTPAPPIDRKNIRRLLGIGLDDFVVCSFGILGPAKLNHRLIDAWINSALSRDERCHLIFVGEARGDYGKMVKESIDRSNCRNNIRVTGWVDTGEFRNYLACADVAVQLRTSSRGETSGAVLDCMSFGLPVIVNAHGSMAELPKDALWMLPDEFEDRELIEALETLKNNVELRYSLGEKARAFIETNHNPSVCALKYYEAIEHFYSMPQRHVHSLIRSIAALHNKHGFLENSISEISNSIALSIYPRVTVKQLLVDVTATAQNDLKTGIERAARAILKTLIENPPSGYRVEPIYLSNRGGLWHYRYARRYALNLLECPQGIFEDEVADLQPGDIVLGLDISKDHLVRAGKAGFLDRCRNLGVKIYFIVHDLLPVTHPEFFPPGENIDFEAWLRIIASLDGAICVSECTLEGLVRWMGENVNFLRRRPFHIAWNHHGADIESSAPSKGLPKDATAVLRELSKKLSFLMVGTVEPRKGYLQVLKAFSSLWEKGFDFNLVIVGKEGWKGLPDSMRRTIPLIVRTIRSHPELGKRLFWLSGISDEYLSRVYKAVKCLIMASEAEGFGLPLIEAARHGVPIVARDIPIFREIAGNHAFYFPNNNSPETLALSLEEWCSLYKKNLHPKVEGMPWLTWKESVKNLLDIVINNKWYYIITKDGTKRL
ncbi:MAG: glycosyltransferase [Syntrophobacterales bacterium]|nr:glycosyltransferase [Syntrophobacterales bacterium]